MTTLVRPAPTADERTQLTGWLDLQRATVSMKCRGLGEVDAHRPVLPSSPLMTMAGVVAHLRWVEHSWFEVAFLGQPNRGPWTDDGHPDAEMFVDDTPLAQLLAEYDAQCALANRIVAEHDLDQVEAAPPPDKDPVSLRWILFHMIEETARHVGHLDAIRELLDGETSYI